MSFRDLHHGVVPLVLPNAWDVASALMFLDEGFPAVGLTSLGLAASRGLVDGSRSVRELTQQLARQLSVLPCHISADLEDGFAESPADVAEYVQQLGVDGINIEDSTHGRLVNPSLHAAKVATIKSRSPDVFINARVDNFWLEQEATIEATLARALCYVEAGADGVFIPGALDAVQIRAFTEAIPVPVNVLASSTHTVEELAALGVRRISTGSLPYRAALDAAVNVAKGVRDGRAATPATSYARIQEMLGSYQQRGPQKAVHVCVCPCQDPVPPGVSR
jgi:2-methylisocitrate lyase-like PEP mutase family enzyme